MSFSYSSGVCWYKHANKVVKIMKWLPYNIQGIFFFFEGCNTQVLESIGAKYNTYLISCEQWEMRLLVMEMVNIEEEMIYLGFGFQWNKEKRVP